MWPENWSNGILSLKNLFWKNVVQFYKAQYFLALSGKDLQYLAGWVPPETGNLASHFLSLRMQLFAINLTAYSEKQTCALSGQC